LAFSSSNGHRLLSVESAERDKATAHEWLTGMPKRRALSEALTLFEQAVSEPATTEDIAVIVGGMLGAHPNAQKMQIDNYVEMLSLVLAVGVDLDDAEELSAFSASAIAYGSVLAAGISHFVPPIAAVVEQSKRARSLFLSAVARTEHLIEMRDSAEDVLIEVGEFDPYRTFDSLFDSPGDDILVKGIEGKCTIEKIDGDVARVRSCESGDRYSVRVRDGHTVVVLGRLDADERQGVE
jgi:hypothetical protein